MLAIQKPNVDVHFTEVVEITDNSVVGKNGIKKDVDTIICATGKLWPKLISESSYSFYQASILRSDLLSQSWGEMVSTFPRSGLLRQKDTLV